MKYVNIAYASMKVTIVSVLRIIDNDIFLETGIYLKELAKTDGGLKTNNLLQIDVYFFFG